MTLRVLAGTALAALMLLHPGKSLASPSFPEEIDKRLDPPCPPPCTICHMTQEGGPGTALQPFVVPMITMGQLAAGKPESVAPALERLAMMGTNTDGDDLPDVLELQRNRDPNVSAAGGVDDAIICPPEYGCGAGARVAPQMPRDGSALAFALVLAAYLVVRSRRRA